MPQRTRLATTAIAAIALGLMACAHPTVKYAVNPTRDTRGLLKFYVSLRHPVDETQVGRRGFGA